MVMATASTINKQIEMHSEVLVHLPVGQVYDILVDFDNLPQVLSSLKAVHILAPGNDGQVRMQVVARICIAFFCFNPTWIQQMQLLPNGEIEAIITPGESDFGKGRAHWSLVPRNRNTLLIFDARLDFKFWLPSVIGPLLLQQKLEEEATLIAQGLERVAAVRFPN
ncbi:MAG: SRPBCC family protein [Amphritea sp.]